ncbi:MAG: GGDEF domain-containing protein [Burkholderiales bacterium]
MIEFLPLSPTAWLVAAQFLLYSVGWVLCGSLLREQRAAVFHWSAFMALFGVGFLLAAQRSVPPTWWAHGGGSIAFVAGYVMLRRGMQLFLGTARRDGENLLILGGVTSGFVVLGAGPDTAAARVVLGQGASALILLRLVLDATPALQAEYGRRVAWLLAAPPVVRAVSFLIGALRQLWSPDVPLEMQPAMLNSTSAVLSFIAAAALFNFGFMALVTLRLVRRLQDQSLRDPLTGLLNRRALDAELQREWLRARRTGATFALLAVDIDHFKSVNDAHGHHGGDAVLVAIAQQLRASARQTDVVARTGGEEFVLLMTGVTARGALEAAQRLRHAVAAASVEHAGRQIGVTVSVGVAMPEPGDIDADASMQRADRLLYAAKAAGRDRVCGDETPSFAR